MPISDILKNVDPEICNTIAAENKRQHNDIELIASENYTSKAVMEAQGSILTNKYAEGYPGKRYYGGCENVDVAESLAIARAKELFGADYANVQPHSGSQANMAVYMALLNPGDRVLGMNLSHGGHLTHGSPVNFSGKLYDVAFYGVNEDGIIDYDEVARIAKEHKPKLIMGGFSAYSRCIDWQKFRDIADEVGAYLVVDMAHVAGLIAAGVYPSPVQIADVTTSTTHKTLRGPRGGLILAKANPDIEKKLNSNIFPGIQGGPLEHVIAAKAVAFKEALQPDFKAYQQQVVTNAQVMAQTLLDRGFKIVSGGTDNHLFLVDLTAQDITGKDAEAALGEINITVNKNTVPGEKRSPFVTSGLRIGTPAITTRGMKEEQAKQIGNWIADRLEKLTDAETANTIKTAVKTLCDKYPVYDTETELTEA